MGEADALDGDVVNYVEALVRETRACSEVFPFAADLSMAQRTTIVRHVQTLGAVDSSALTRGAVASLAAMDAPVVMLVDPWPMSSERRTAPGKLKGRGHIPKLLEMGFYRMVGSRFVWAWNRELSEGLMSDYSYDQLLTAKREGLLAKVLTSPMTTEMYGELPPGLAADMGFPRVEDFDPE